MNIICGHKLLLVVLGKKKKKQTNNWKKFSRMPVRYNYLIFKTAASLLVNILLLMTYLL